MEYPNLLNIFPRIMGMPNRRRIVMNSKERDTYIKKWATQHPIYISVYPFKKIIEENLHEMHQHAVVPYIVFDIDPDDCVPYDEMMDFHNYLRYNDIMHRIHLSGRGFHVFVWIKQNIEHKKIALANYWDFVHGNKLGNYTNPFNEDKNYHSPNIKVCSSTRGDLGRIIRYPNTYNFKSKSYCIIIDIDILTSCKSMEDIQQYAKKPYIPKSSFYFGSRYLDISEFDCTEEQYATLPDQHLSISYSNFKDMEANEEVEFDFEALPWCITEFINDKHGLHFDYRNEVIKFLFNRRDTLIPYGKNDVLGILKKIAKKQVADNPKNQWLNWFFTHNSEYVLYRNISVVYDNHNVLSGCYNISRMGYCNRSECSWKNIVEKN